MGVAMAFALPASVARVESGRVDLTILRRATLLVLLGLVLNVASAWPHPLSARIPSVLQRLGATYLFAALIAVRTTPRRQAAIAAILLAAHWGMLRLGGSLEPAVNLAARVDRTLFGTHLLTPFGDPEGVLGIMPSVATALLGAVAGRWLQTRTAGDHAHRGTAARLAAAGLAVAATGMLWSTHFPLNKSLWTGSFALLTTGAVLVALAVCLAAERTLVRRVLAPAAWLGVNPLALYFLSELTATVLQRPWLGDSSPRDALFWNVLVPLVGDHGEPRSSLLFALFYLLLWIGVARLLKWRST